MLNNKQRKLAVNIKYKVPPRKKLVQTTPIEWLFKDLMEADVWLSPALRIFYSYELLQFLRNHASKEYQYNWTIILKERNQAKLVELIEKSEEQYKLYETNLMNLAAEHIYSSEEEKKSVTLILCLAYYRLQDKKLITYLVPTNRGLVLDFKDTVDEHI